MNNPIVTFLLFLLCANSLKAQLKEFEITTLPKPEISLVQANTEFGEDALIIIYSSLTNLNFRSSMGMIDKQSYNQQSNRYEVLVRPIKQILLVYSNGFMEGTISTINPNAKDVFYFKVEEKKTVILNQTILGKLTINSNPAGANISLNGISITNKTPFTGELNPGSTRIQITKSKYYAFDTVMNVQSSINDVLTINLKPSTLWLNIKSNPSSAQVELDGKILGKTPLSIEQDLIDKSKQGDHILKLSLTDYASVNQKVQFYPSIEPLVINFELKKLEGAFKIITTPLGAEVFINGEFKGHSPLQGDLPVGSYKVDFKMEEYVTSVNNQLLVNKKTVASLNVDLKLRSLASDTSENEFSNIGFVRDASGNSYKTVQIGNQLWMAENLKTYTYSNGEPIPNISNQKEWSNDKTGAWSNYNNLTMFDDIYGKLYNWYAVADNRNVCPIGWHVPTDADWTILSDFLGGYQVAGGKMKSTGISKWEKPNKRATNESEFSGLPAGSRYRKGAFGAIGKYSYFWSSTEINSIVSNGRFLYFGNRKLYKNIDNKRSGFSVRCLRD
jgi:uncharacterized protein (TIGR02145 family)